MLISKHLRVWVSSYMNQKPLRTTSASHRERALPLEPQSLQMEVAGCQLRGINRTAHRYQHVKSRMASMHFRFRSRLCDAERRCGLADGVCVSLSLSNLALAGGQNVSSQVSLRQSHPPAKDPPPRLQRARGKSSELACYRLQCLLETHPWLCLDVGKWTLRSNEK